MNWEMKGYSEWYDKFPQQIPARDRFDIRSSNQLHRSALFPQPDGKNIARAYPVTYFLEYSFSRNCLHFSSLYLVNPLFCFLCS